MPKPKLTDEQWLAEMRACYPHVDFAAEERKMRAWLSVNPGRQITRRFQVNWWNKVPVPAAGVTPTRPQPKPIAKPKPDTPMSAAEWDQQAAELRSAIAARQGASIYDRWLASMLETAEQNAKRVRAGQPAIPLRLSAGRR